VKVKGGETAIVFADLAAAPFIGNRALLQRQVFDVRFESPFPSLI
jgi:hypothetical protein